MIKTFRHAGIERFFRTGSKAGIQPAHAAKLSIQLYALDGAKSPADLNTPGWRMHPLKGDLEGHWSIRVNGNWRLTFNCAGKDVDRVDYEDYH